jgi:hypothetical protein
MLNPLTQAVRHFNRVLSYMRPSDLAAGTGLAAAGPALFYFMERMSPSRAGRGAFAPMMRAVVAIGSFGGFLLAYQNSAGELGPCKRVEY